MKQSAAVVIAEIEEKILDIQFLDDFEDEFFEEFENKFPQQFKDGHIRFVHFIESDLDVIHIVGMNILVFKSLKNNLIDYREKIKHISIREVQKSVAN